MIIHSVFLFRSLLSHCLEHCHFQNSKKCGVDWIFSLLHYVACVNEKAQKNWNVIQNSIPQERLPPGLTTEIHLNVHCCTFRKVVALHFHRSKPSLDVDEDPLLFLKQFRPKSIVGINHCSGDDNQKVKCYQKSDSNEGVLVSLPFYKLKNVMYVEVRNSLTKCFTMFSNVDMPTFQKSEVHRFSLALVFKKIRKLVIFLKFTLFNFPWYL